MNCLTCALGSDRLACMQVRVDHRETCSFPFSPWPSPACLKAHCRDCLRDSRSNGSAPWPGTGNPCG
jgi:hypothetical protein